MERLRRFARSDDGYTLTELMVVLGVVGILMAIAIPTNQLLIGRQNLRGSARQVVEVLRGARDAAVNEGVPRYVAFEAETYRVYRYDDSQWVPDHNEIPLRGSTRVADTTLPAVSDAPESGASVPEAAAYFDTRGRYPSGYTGSYTITLSERMGDPVVLTLYPQTGQVTGV